MVGSVPIGYVEDRLWSDRFLVWLSLVLMGYALMGRGFAYLGFPPLFIGEITLLFGLAVLVSSGMLWHVVGTPVTKVLIIFMIWGALRTIPYLSIHGADALRDSVVWFYAVFAFISAGLLLQKPERLRLVLLQYRKFVFIFLAVIPVLYVVHKMAPGMIPRPFPGSPAIFTVKSGDVLTHLACITAFVMVGMVRAHPGVIALIGMNFLMVGSANRGGLLTFTGVLLLVLLLRPGQAQVARVVVGLIFFVALIGIAGVSIGVKASRPVSIEQLWMNVESVFTSTASRSMSGTKEWRMDWWGEIVNYTIYGPYFWTGKGFGINLADDDGFQVLSGSALRSPHNGHMTILARTGVPGLGLWLLLQLAWLYTLFKRFFRSRFDGDHEWEGIFLFIIACWLAFLVNASFDVFIEGPMGGIWFWSLFGVGLAASMIYDKDPEVIR